MAAHDPHPHPNPRKAGPAPRSVTVRVFLTAPKPKPGVPPQRPTQPKALKPLDVQLEGHREHTDLARKVIQQAIAAHVSVRTCDVLLHRAEGGGWIAYASLPQ